MICITYKMRLVFNDDYYQYIEETNSFTKNNQANNCLTLKKFRGKNCWYFKSKRKCRFYFIWGKDYILQN